MNAQAYGCRPASADELKKAAGGQLIRAASESGCQTASASRAASAHGYWYRHDHDPIRAMNWKAGNPQLKL